MQTAPIDPDSIQARLTEAERALAAGPHPERARRDAETLLLHVLRRHAPERNLAWLIAHVEDCLSADAVGAFRAFFERRFAGEPLQYILGETEFYGMAFHVNREVLIPRPETEHLVEESLALAAHFPHPRIVDIGTGSGAIATTLARHLPAAQIFATDLSAQALAVARQNARRHGVFDRISFVEGDLLAPLANQQFDLVVSNPPYVPENDRGSLSVEVHDYEPPQALFAGVDGLSIYRRLIPAAFAVLVSGGFVVLEIGYGQQKSIHTLLADAGFSKIEFTPDLQGIPRIASARRA